MSFAVADCREKGQTGVKAVIPVAGVGTRLRPHTHTVPKALLYVAGKPILGHIIDRVSALGVEQIVLVVGHMGDRIREFVAENYDLPIQTVVQDEPRLAVCAYAVMPPPLSSMTAMMLSFSSTTASSE